MQKQGSTSSEPVKAKSNNNEQCNQKEYFGSPEDVKVWEDARCPVCLEPPHNAVLLRCSSFNKGCLPFLCNTSCRHSNCLDQFLRSSVPSPPNRLLIGTGTEHELACPLCRGQIYAWYTINLAREYMNLKARSCSSENCDFVGNYYELRKHARSKHPTVRPSAVDPQRQQNWIMLEDDTNASDLLSALPSMDLGFGDEEEEVEQEEDVTEIGGRNLEYVDGNLCFGSVDQYAEWNISIILPNLNVNVANNNFRQANSSDSLPPNQNNTNNSREHTTGRSNSLRYNSNIRENNNFEERFPRRQNNYRHNYVNNNLNLMQNNSFRGNNTERMRIRRINNRRPIHNNRRNGLDGRGN